MLQVLLLVALSQEPSFKVSLNFDWNSTDPRSSPPPNSVGFRMTAGLGGTRTELPIAFLDRLYDSLGGTKSVTDIELQCPQIFASSRGTTLLFALGFDGKGYYIPSLKEKKNISGQRVYVFRQGWSSLRPFGPAFTRKYLYGLVKDKVHYLHPCGFSVSPNGNKVVGEFTWNHKVELWYWNLNHGGQKCLWSGSWHPGDYLPKYGFFWKNHGFYWTERSGGPMFFVNARHQINQVLAQSPFYLDVQQGYAFEFAEKFPVRGAKSVYLGSKKAHLIVKKVRFQSGGQISLGTTFYKSHFWVYPNMTEFFLNKVGPHKYFIEGSREKNYILNLQTNHLATLRSPGSPVELLTSSKAIAGYYNENLMALNAAPYSVKGNVIHYNFNNGKSLRIELYHSRVIGLEVGGQIFGFYKGSAGPLSYGGGMKQDRNEYFRPYPCTSNQASLWPIDDAWHRYEPVISPGP